MIGLSIALGLNLVNEQKPDPAATFRQAMGAVPQAVKDPINAFSIDTLAKLSLSSGGKNLMISPWSLQECFGMLRLGAKGQTDKELAAWLKQPGTPTASAKGLQQLRTAIAPLLATDQMRQANGIWVKKDFGIEAQFTKDAQSYFGAKAQPTTFPNPGLKLINSFVSDQTRGKIPKLFDQIDPETGMVLVNAVSFLDKWSTPFKKSDTKNMPFTTAGGNLKQVPTMVAHNDYLYTKNDVCQAISLPYQSGLSMLVVLPNKGMTVTRILTRPDLLKALNASLRAEPCTVYIPKWKSEYSWDLKTWMKQQGVKTPFDPMRADFRGLSKTRMIIDKAVQKTFIRVDEEGTEASAATGIIMRPTSMRPSQPIEFRADHPFAYFIYSGNGVVFFSGIVNNP